MWPSRFQEVKYLAQVKVGRISNTSIAFPRGELAAPRDDAVITVNPQELRSTVAQYVLSDIAPILCVQHVSPTSGGTFGLARVHVHVRVRAHVLHPCFKFFSKFFSIFRQAGGLLSPLTGCPLVAQDGDGVLPACLWIDLSRCGSSCPDGCRLMQHLEPPTPNAQGLCLWRLDHNVSARIEKWLVSVDAARRWSQTRRPPTATGPGTSC